MATENRPETGRPAPEDEPTQEPQPRPIVVRPATPLAMRVNRNVLVVAAVIMAVTVVTAVVLLNPQGAKPGSATSREDSSTPVTSGPSTPSFLERPPTGVGVTPGRAGDSTAARPGSPPAPDRLETAASPAIPLSPAIERPVCGDTTDHSASPSAVVA
jgi:hypothetical protein